MITHRQITFKEIRQHIGWDLSIKGAAAKYKDSEEKIGENWVYLIIPGTLYVLMTMLVDLSFTTYIMAIY
jgi:hypothetical protein